MRFLTFVLLVTCSISAAAMNKAELIDAIASNSGLSKADSKRALAALSDTSAQRLRRQGAVFVPGFGLLSRGIGSDLTCVATDPLPRRGRRCIEFFPAGAGEAAIIDTWLENTLTDAMNQHAAAQDYAVEECRDRADEDFIADCPDNGDGALARRAAFGGASAGTLASVARAYDVAGAINRGGLPEGLGTFWAAELGKAMTATGGSERLAEATVDTLVTSLAAQAARIVEIRQEVQASKGSRATVRLVQRVARRSGLSVDEVTALLNALGEVTRAELARGESVSLVGFGSFSISKRAARTGRNPQTGATIRASAGNVVRFKAGADLSKKVN